MLKRNKTALVVNSLLTLLPIPASILLRKWLSAGLFLSEKQLPTWVFWSCLSMLGVMWLCVAFTAADAKGRGNRNEKALARFLWMVPGISIFSFLVLCSTAAGIPVFRTSSLMLLFFGVLFLVTGNYLPKVGQNQAIGIRIAWTLGDEENWNATHRFSGKVWVLGGALLLSAVLLPGKWAFILLFAVLTVLVALPLGYSYRFYRRKLAAQVPKEQLLPQPSKKDALLQKIVLAIVAVALIFVCLLMFTGHIDYVLGEQALTVHATYYQDLTLPYESIRSISYQEGAPGGSRALGVANARILLGLFQNQELGSYTRYTYTNPEGYILIHTGFGTLALADRDAEATQALYQSLLSRISDTDK